MYPGAIPGYRTKNFDCWPRTWLKRLKVVVKYWKKLQTKFLRDNFIKKRTKNAKIESRVIWRHLTSNDASFDVRSRHEDNLTGSAVGPNNDLYYIFASSKRPMRIWKRPIVFSMIYHQYQKRMKKSIGRLNNVYVYNVYHFKLISYGKKT